MSLKDTIELMRQIANGRGGKCLSTKYINQRTPLEWECAEGHYWSAKPSDVKGTKNKPGTWCKICGKFSSAQKRMRSIQDMHELANNKGLLFHSTTYNGSSEKHLWWCKEHKVEFSATPRSVQQNDRPCPRCQGIPTLTELNELARSMRKNSLAKCFSRSYQNTSSLLEWQCGIAEHPPFKKSYRSVKHDGSWCDQCPKERAKIYNLDFCRRLAERCNGQLVSNDKYLNTKQMLTWKCVDGHTFERSLDYIFSSLSFCPECSSKTGLREEYIRDLFEHMFKVPFERVRNLDWLKNNRGKNMELDGYNKELSIAFEHNGLQHYEVDGYFIKDSAQLKQRIEDDNNKKLCCMNNNVNLIVIPHSIAWDKIQAHVTSELEKLPLDKPINREDFPRGLFAHSKLEKLKNIASDHGGKLYSTEYKGSGEKLLWKCKFPEHDKFEMNWNSVQQGRWCDKCADDKRSQSYRVSIRELQKWAQDCKGKIKINPLDLVEDRKYASAEKIKVRCSLCKRDGERTVKQIKAGTLCLCLNKKIRINHKLLAEKLKDKSIKLLGPEIISGGKDRVTLRCMKAGCSGEWIIKASYVMNNSVGCPKCRRNASITVEKARQLGNNINFNLLSIEVKNGMQSLEWECKKCGWQVNKSYRMMRNIRRCEVCSRNYAHEARFTRIES